VNNTGTKKVSIMKQTAFLREENGECAKIKKQNSVSKRIMLEAESTPGP
jgi:hypothetical protein